jgi:predicted GH43/DUF377 family glycosyl hydrolase
MKNKLLLIAAMFAAITTANGQNQPANSNLGSWVKYENNPVLTNLGIIYDANVLKNDDGKYQMFCTWYDGQGLGLSESADGLHWEKPVNILSFGDYAQKYAWEKRINRPSVLEKDGIYHLWYCAQAIGDDNRWHSYIGYAVSKDGKTWTKKSDLPALSPDQLWEGIAVQYPSVIWDEKEKLLKMWYSGGEQFEPDAIGYATSNDGLHWQKQKANPIFTANKKAEWEKAKVASCQVIKRANDYLMIYTGYEDIDHAEIGMAKSKDGITKWERCKANPILKPGTSGWDADAIYMPYLLPDTANNRWLLYYSGRHNWSEKMGIAVHQGIELGF